ncbi:MAG: polysaccharide export protein [Verrucomicrobia bacterium]|nr:polysaccharide export protein [Verrucomicrobiota bacterium]
MNKAYLSISLSLLLTACGSLPVAGPSTSKILSAGKKENSLPSGKFTLLSVNDHVLDVLRDSGIKCVNKACSEASQQAPATQKISIGDVINVAIYTTGGGLFSGGTTLAPSSPSMPGKEGGVSIGTSVPSQIVDQGESITVPYVGRIKVTGKAPSEVEAEIAERMKGMAFNPYAIVTMNDRVGSDLVTVTGDVKQSQRVRVPLPGLRVADAIAQVGGGTGRDFETDYTVIRGGHTFSGNLSTALRNPATDIFLKSGDILSVKVNSWSYQTLGATGQTLRPFPHEQFTILEAIAGSNGLDDNRANPGGVFVYRLESPEVLHRLGLRTDRDGSTPQPVIYHLNLRDAGGFFKAKQFCLKDKDLVYVGNAGIIGFQKVMGVIGALTAPAVTGLSATAGVGAVKTLSQ